MALRQIAVSFAVIAGLFLAGIATSNASKPWPELSTPEKIYGLSVFWKEASYNFAFFDQVSDLNWDSVYAAYIP